MQCIPPKKEVLKRTKNIAKQIKAKSVFVATDNNAMLDELTKALKKLGICVAFSNSLVVNFSCFFCSEDMNGSNAVREIQVITAK